jgi:hypothetical protein
MSVLLHLGRAAGYGISKTVGQASFLCLLSPLHLWWLIGSSLCPFFKLAH